MDIFTGKGGIIKTKWNGVFIKNRAFLIGEGFLIKRVSEAYWQMEEEGTAQELCKMFL
jgi:hypothetical protein